MLLELVLLHVLQIIHGACEDTGSGRVYQTLTLALSGRYILLLG
jgi:hypothetical protein